MFYVCSCPIEPNGSAGFWRCSDGTTLLIQCYEWESLWEYPAGLGPSDSFRVDPQGYILPNRRIQVYGGRAGWATLDKIEAVGWRNFIAGESTALNEG